MSFFNRKPEPLQAAPIQRSAYFPDKFYTNKTVTIDDSIEFFVRKSIIKLPKDPIFISGFKQWKLGEDWFEEIFFDEDRYKLLYDKTQDIYYLLESCYKRQAQSLSEWEGDSQSVMYSGLTYNAFTGSLDIEAKNILMALFNREISHEADEYLFLEMDSKFQERTWVGVIVQPPMIK